MFYYILSISWLYWSCLPVQRKVKIHHLLDFVLKKKNFSYYSEREFAVKTCIECLTWIPKILFVRRSHGNQSASLYNDLFLVEDNHVIDIVNPLSEAASHHKLLRLLKNLFLQRYSDQTNEILQNKFLKDFQIFFEVNFCALLNFFYIFFCPESRGLNFVDILLSSCKRVL